MTLDLQVRPNNQELEESLLGCLIIDSEQYWRVEPFIPTEEIFYTSKNKRLFCQKNN